MKHALFYIFGLAILTVTIATFFNNKEQHVICDKLILQGVTAYYVEGIVTSHCFVTQQDVYFTQVPIGDH